MPAQPTHAAQQRLRRKLTRRAGIAVVVLFALILACTLAAYGAFRHAPWDGNPPAALLMLALGGLCLAAALRVGGWLWAPQPAPLGLRVPDHMAPRFRRRIDSMCRRLGVPPIEEILVTPDMNAALVCRPRHGLFGRMRTTLLLGVPLIHSLTPAQLAAVLMHELAHLRTQREGLDAWAAHVRAWWLRIQDRIDDDASPLGKILRRLLEPTLLRDLERTLRLSRMDEFEADAWAARRIGKRQLAAALIEVELKGRFLTENYWCKVMEQARHLRRPSFRPFRDMGLGMQAGFVRDEAVADLSAVLADQDDSPPLDTHPTLHERLAQLRVRRRFLLVSPHGGPSAAEHYFADLMPEFSATFDRLWWRASRQEWLRCHRAAARRPSGDGA